MAASYLTHANISVDKQRRRGPVADGYPSTSPYAELDEPMFSKSPSLRQRHKLLGILTIMQNISNLLILTFF